MKIKICTNYNCSVNIQEDNTWYLPEDTTESIKDKFKYSDTLSIDVLQHNGIDETKIFVPTFTKHNNENNKTSLNVSMDGWFSVVHIILPTIDWVKAEYEKNLHGLLFAYKTVYFSDGQVIYKLTNNTSELQYTQVPLKEIIEVNTTDTTLDRTSSDYVAICYLQQCFISLCKQIFSNKNFSKCFTYSADNDLMYKRDLVWMTINVVKYLVEFNQLAEAERLINSIGGCNGLCKREFQQFPNRGCGCNK